MKPIKSDQQAVQHAPVKIHSTSADIPTDRVSGVRLYLVRVKLVEGLRMVSGRSPVVEDAGES